MTETAGPKRRWRDYRTVTGRRPVKEFVDSLSDADAAEIAAAMKEVQQEGLRAAKHLRGELYEVIADGERQTFRILFAPVGRRNNILLALDGFSKKTRKTRSAKLQLAQRRLSDWMRRGEASR